jgi:protein-L-isoaspartate O-methyltransferase
LLSYANQLQETKRSMLVNQLQARDITEQRVLEDFRQVPREKFVDPQLRYRAYIDKASAD